MGEALTIEAPAISPERVTPLKPSEALRLGRLLAPRWTCGKLFNFQTDGYCALGAMARACGNRLSPSAQTYWWNANWSDAYVGYPCVCFAVPGSIEVPHVVAHLSDGHSPFSEFRPLNDDVWPDARIADWLESIGL